MRCSERIARRSIIGILLIGEICLIQVLGLSSIRSRRLLFSIPLDLLCAYQVKVQVSECPIRHEETQKCRNMQTYHSHLRNSGNSTESPGRISNRSPGHSTQHACWISWRISLCRMSVMLSQVVRTVCQTGLGKTTDRQQKGACVTSSTLYMVRKTVERKP